MQCQSNKNLHECTIMDKLICGRRWTQQSVTWRACMDSSHQTNKEKEEAHGFTLDISIRVASCNQTRDNRIACVCEWRGCTQPLDMSQQLKQHNIQYNTSGIDRFLQCRTICSTIYILYLRRRAGGRSFLDASVGGFMAANSLKSLWRTTGSMSPLSVKHKLPSAPCTVDWTAR